MQREKNAKLEKIRALVRKKKANQKKNKKLKSAVSPPMERSPLPLFDENDLMKQEEQHQDVDPNDPEFKHKLKYEDPFEDVIEGDVVQENIDNEDSDDDDYESIDAEDIVSS